jgi:multidrug resistance protein
LTTFVVGLAFGPLFLAPLSEFYGRKPVYLVSYFFFIIWQIPTAVAQNIGTILVTRFLAGFSGSAFLSVAGGSITDMWAADKVAWPMVAFTIGPFLGPTIGPLVGGFINQHVVWRWTFYVIIIWSAVEV